MFQNIILKMVALVLKHCTCSLVPLRPQFFNVTCRKKREPADEATVHVGYAQFYLANSFHKTELRV